MTTPASTSKMVATKKKVLSCSTPEHRNESPSRDSDSLCDSEAASPVPFLCTQDGAEGETDVVWNFYTPNSKCAAKSRLQNATPLSRKSRKVCKFKLIEKPITRRRVTKPSQKNTELFQDLLELNQNLQELITKKAKTNVITEKQCSGSEDDIFNDSGESSPKSGHKTNTRCLRKNLLSSKFAKPEADNALESDDSMNECLLKASQVIEENILSHNPVPAKRPRFENSNKTLKAVNPSLQFNIDQDSMDAILNSIKLDSPAVNHVKKIASPSLKNDSFDNFVGNLNDSALDRLTQMPIKSNVTNRSKLNISRSGADWTIQEVVLHESSPISKSFGRHNSMPESPRVTDILNKPSTSGMVFGRYSSMPHDKNKNLGDSPIRCTPDEIRRKHQQAREKLLAKRLLPFTQSTPHTAQPLPKSIQSAVSKKTFQPKTATSMISVPQNTASAKLDNKVENTAQPLPTSLQSTVAKKTHFFQPKTATSIVSVPQNTASANLVSDKVKNTDKSSDIKLLIEKKRQEALLKLRKRQPPNKMP